MGTTTSHMSSARLCITLLCALGVATATVHVPWTAGFDDASARAKTVTTGDTLHFMWTGSHNVFQMASETAFNDCDFTGATDKGSTSPVSVPLRAFGPWYFACQVGAHCTNGQKLAVTNGVTTAPTTAAPTAVSPTPPTSSTTSGTGEFSSAATVTSSIVTLGAAVSVVLALLAC